MRRFVCVAISHTMQLRHVEKLVGNTAPYGRRDRTGIDKTRQESQKVVFC